MPASFRPNLFATLTLATTVSMTGCIFPFTRSSDSKLTELVTEEPLPQPKQQVAAAPKPEADKKMPPFARFLGGMFGGQDTTQAEPEPDPINLNAPEPTQQVAEVPTQTPAPQPSAIQPAQDLVQKTPQTPIFNPPANQMPVIVTPETNPMADKPDVVSQFTQKATQLIESPRPEVVVQPMPTPQVQPQPQPTSEVAPAAQVAKTTPVKLGDEALAAHARSPWGERKLLDMAKANSSTSTTTLEHSLELALETVRRERLGEGPAPAVETTKPQPEMTVQADVEKETLAPAATESALPPMKVAANPLRSSNTRTDWSGSSLRDSQPQTIVNNTVSKYPQTDSKWSQKLEPTQPAPEEVAKQEGPAAEPQVTVNPYAKTVGEAITATQTLGPQLVDNSAATTKTADAEPQTTDDIHFQSSLLSKLQAANRQAKWDFDTTPQQPEPAAEVATMPENAMPKIVDNEAVQPELPLVSASEPEPAPTPTVQPKTTINPSVAQVETKDEPQEIKPFIIAEPSRAAPVHRGLIRAAEPQPLVMENQDGNWQNVAPKQLPKLAPVVRASDYQRPTAPSSGSKTYIVN
ncbi:hypothetical protein Pan97_21150 [Bremerella volcania]|uniref:Uncharacterized protein n=1 Tax=Bremerella volcania TaxID=2527984 RepID=A0A518C7B3_9BACT|nr:hypothetical protein [Bremerella volcania]QDU75094.1 hypothetical protein Pan97_21150 [Bremerella volcania]